MNLTVLTGASRGLGHALYQELRARNEPLIVVVRQRGELKVDSDRTLVEFDLASVTESTGAERLSKLLEDALLGRVFDRLVYINNAGSIEPIGLIGSLSAAAIAASAAVNFVAPAIVADVCLRVAKTIGTPFSVLNISSGAATHPIPGWAAYCATKASARMFFDVLSEEEKGVVVHHIDPGIIDTDMQAAIRNASRERFPLVDRFVAYAEDGQLQSPEAAASHILREYFEWTCHATCAAR